MQFSIGTFFLGILVTIGGALTVRFYKEISDNLASGVSSYDKVRLVGLGTTVFGVLFAFGLIQLVTLQIIKLVFPAIG